MPRKPTGKDDRALELSESGMTHAQIQAEMGYATLGAVGMAIGRARSRRKKNNPTHGNLKAEYASLMGNLLRGGESGDVDEAAVHTSVLTRPNDVPPPGPGQSAADEPESKEARKMRERMERARRNVRALELLGAGYSRQHILATVKGFKSIDAVDKVISRALDDHESLSVEQYRALTSQRLDKTLMRLEQIHDMSDEPSLAVIDMQLKTIDRQMKLHGIEAPKKVEQTTKTEVEGAVMVVQGSTVDFINQMRQMRGHAPVAELTEAEQAPLPIPRSDARQAGILANPDAPGELLDETDVVDAEIVEDLA